MKTKKGSFKWINATLKSLLIISSIQQHSEFLEAVNSRSLLQCSKMGSVSYDFQYVFKTSIDSFVSFSWAILYYKVIFEYVNLLQSWWLEVMPGHIRRKFAFILDGWGLTSWLPFRKGSVVSNKCMSQLWLKILPGIHTESAFSAAVYCY